MKTIYLDHAATSPVHPEVAEKVYEVMKDHFGNASSIHSFGRDSRKILDQARITFAESIGAKPNEIVITSGGTESDNTAIIGTALSRQSEGKHIITTSVEHHAVLRPMEHLETLGFDLTYLPVNRNGLVAPESVADAIRPDTILISVIFGNNETGSLTDISAIGKIIEASGTKAYFHTDAVQAYGSEEIDVKRDRIDLLSVSAHKINGPKGVGFLYINEAVHLPSFMKGGEQEMKRRAGTENIPAIAGFQKAVEISRQERKARVEKYRSFREKLLEKLTQNAVEFELNGDQLHHLPHVLNIWLKDMPSELLLMNLDLAGIAVSAGSACTAGNVDPSHVLSAMYGCESPAIAESIRISFGLGNTMDDITALADELTKITRKLANRKQMS